MLSRPEWRKQQSNIIHIQSPITRLSWRGVFSFYCCFHVFLITIKRYVSTIKYVTRALDKNSSSDTRSLNTSCPSMHHFLKKKKKEKKKNTLTFCSLLQHVFLPHHATYLDVWLVKICPGACQVIPVIYWDLCVNEASESSKQRHK